MDSDQIFRLQTKLEGIAHGLAKGIVRALDESDKKFLREVIVALSKKNGSESLKKESEKIESLMKTIETIRGESFSVAEQKTRETMESVAQKTQENDIAALGSQGRELTPLGKREVASVLDYSPFGGATRKDWFKNYREDDLRRIKSTIFSGMSRSLSLDEIVRSIHGTKENGYSDGILQTSRNSATMIARTLINGVQNEVRNELYLQNEDVIDGIRFVATLDGRTSFICASLDGTVWKKDEFEFIQTPPMHINCRSTLIPHVEIRDENGNVIDPSTRPAANADFDKLAQDDYNEKAREKGWERRWDDLSQSTRQKYYYDAQKRFADEHGPAYSQVSGSTSFKEWFDAKGRTESGREFQESWLGRDRYELYREGKIGIDSLVKSDSGHVVKISELDPKGLLEEKKESRLKVSEAYQGRRGSEETGWYDLAPGKFPPGQAVYKEPKGKLKKQALKDADVEFERIRGDLEKAGRTLNPDLPREVHSEVMKERPQKWTPNSSLDVLGKDGNLLQRRFYDSNGDIEEMIDYIHGNSWDHIFPHRHVVIKNERSKPIRF